MIQTAHLPATPGVYAIVCMRRAWKHYVGSSLNVKRRVADHRRHLRLGEHRNERMQQSFAKYGETAFEVILLEACAASDLAVREQAYMDTHRAAHPASGFNIAPRAYNGAQSEETRAKISASQAGRVYAKPSLATREKMRVAATGRKLDDAGKAKISKFHKGREWSADQLANLRAAQKMRDPATRYRVPKGTKLSAQTKAKISAAGKGKKQTPDLIERRAAANRGKKRSAATIANIRAAVNTPEAKANKSASLRATFARRREMKDTTKASQ